MHVWVLAVKTAVFVGEETPFLEKPRLREGTPDQWQQEFRLIRVRVAMPAKNKQLILQNIEVLCKKVLRFGEREGGGGRERERERERER